jgi:hypothetical protein
MITATTDAVTNALDEMRTMLQADGYDLQIEVKTGTATLIVLATPTACAECLVPKEILASMAASMLHDGGISAEQTDIRMEYPLDH